MDTIGVFLLIAVGLILLLAILLSKSKKIALGYDPDVDIKSAKRNGYRLKDVEPDDGIYIEFNRAKQKTSFVRVLNNDPMSSKIWIEIRWSNYKESGCDEYENFILNYDDYYLRSFSLLNPKKRKFKKQEPLTVDTYVQKLQKDIDEAVSREDYELAESYRKILEKFTKE